MKIAPWRITWAEFTFTDEEATVADASTVSLIVGDSTWTVCNPWHGHVVLGAWVAVAIIRATSCTVDEAVAVVAAMPLSQLVSALDEREV